MRAPDPDGRGSNRLWYRRPAQDWQSEALPIGNGRLGAMLHGQVGTERVQFNEQSMWSGVADYDNARAGRPDDAFDTGPLDFGSYLAFGDLFVTIRGLETADIRAYERTLDLRSAVHRTTFVVDASPVEIEAFASRDADVIVVTYRLGRTADIVVQLRSSHLGSSGWQDAETASIGFGGSLPNGLQYAAAARIIATDGIVAAGPGTLRVHGATEVSVILDARTDYRANRDSGWRGEAPEPRVRHAVDRACGVGSAALREDHVAQAKSVASRVHVDWGASDEALRGLPTDERIDAYRRGGEDPELEQTMFAYGRYLLWASSRPGGLPANLQGLWNGSNTPPWAADYHTNINVQMNYWSAETCDLPETHEALIEFIRAMAPSSRSASRLSLGDDVPGWTARTSQSIFGGNSWEWNTVASAWYAQHVAEHWAFRPDGEYLRDVALPMLDEICRFWDYRLVENENGELVSPDGWSPEHGPREDGVTYDQQIIWDLFENYLTAATAAGVAESEFATRVRALQSRLSPNRVGRWGQLQEWQSDIDDPDSIHRHTSHLFGVFPGRQITPTHTPRLAAAASISLRARCGARPGEDFTESSVSGDSRQSWVWPWRCALFARLGDAEGARRMIRGLLTFNSFTNLFCHTNGDVFQIDGNLGFPAGVVEMLLQSHDGTIHLLPALPAAWRDGSFRGLRARGGFGVDCRWRDGRVAEFTIRADRTAEGQPVRVRVNGEVRLVHPTREGEEVRLSK
ncbi:glycoside hydrolase family 95 protein [Microbacterium sp. 4R-513]|nr:glycoside hydrolase family 95 protein [Microbacterium sp. 4R-513]QIG39444.1 glycoside hydrolase family 95 protein [Microbacterium sp. 4R-513]